MNGIVVLGGGIGDLSASFELKDLLGKRHRLTLRSDQPNFEFSPSNPSVGLRWPKPRAIRLNLGELWPEHGIQFVDSAALLAADASRSAAR